MVEELDLEGVFIATIVSAIVLPSMLISAVAPFDKNSLEMKVVRDGSRVSNGYLLENFFNLFLYFWIAARSRFELLNSQPESKVFVAIFLFQKCKKFLKWWELVKSECFHDDFLRSRSVILHFFLFLSHWSFLSVSMCIKHEYCATRKRNLMMRNIHWLQ